MELTPPTFFYLLFYYNVSIYPMARISKSITKDDEIYHTHHNKNTITFLYDALYFNFLYFDNCDIFGMILGISS